MPSATSVISVSELNRSARLALEKSLLSCWVSGEISNLVRASSGHWYFTLKDENCSVKCAFFRSRVQFVNWRPNDGDKVEIRAQATIYETRGDYQLIVDSMRRAGLGGIYEEFMRLKVKLEAEGLFRAEDKLKLPKYPLAIGIITSLQAAALQDVLITLENRWPHSSIVIYPCSVQGNDAVESIIRALNAANSRNECDVLLLIRGGGSLEDMIAYNDETLSRAIHGTRIPIVSGIGHETDFSIADFVVDQRAATPTAAAQVATPDSYEITKKLDFLRTRTINFAERVILQKTQHYTTMARRISHPGVIVALNLREVNQLARRLAISLEHKTKTSIQNMNGMHIRIYAQRPNLATLKEIQVGFHNLVKQSLCNSLAIRKSRIQRALESLQQLNPENILNRGYCIARTRQGALIRSTNQVSVTDEIDVIVSNGKLQAKISRITGTDEKQTPRCAGR